MNQTTTSNHTPVLTDNRIISGGRHTLGVYHLHNAVVRISATTSNREPQTAAYQAAVDNVWFEIEQNAREIQSAWIIQDGTTWFSRWDYELWLDREISQAIR